MHALYLAECPGIYTANRRKEGDSFVTQYYDSYNSNISSRPQHAKLKINELKLLYSNIELAGFVHQ